MSVLKALWDRKWVLRSIFSTIYFNFRCLPLSQAWKLPVILYKPHFGNLSGKVIIEGKVRPGIVQLGQCKVPFYPDSGIKINLSGIAIFRGSCMMGNDCCLSVGKGATLTIGDHFYASCSLKLSCVNKVEILENATVGWDCIITDSDFHTLTKVEGGYTKGYGEIHIGKNNWLATRCVVLKNTKTPDYCTTSASSTLSRDYTLFGNNVIIGNKSDVEILKTGVYHNPYDDRIQLA